MKRSLMIHEEAGEKLVEAYHLAHYLGYAQQHLLRKQVLHDWPHIFKADVDYRLVHDEEALRRYETAHAVLGFGEIKPMKSARGRMFFTASGVQKVLHHTSKDIRFVEEDLRRAGLPFGLYVEKGNGAGESTQVLAPQGDPAVTSQEDLGNRSSSLEQRRWEYEVLERLLSHLQNITDHHLQKLAITSAEVALGREFKELRTDLESARVHNALAAMVNPTPPSLVNFSRTVVVDPMPPPDPFYTLSEIGAQAGGYSARAAGMAANLVAARCGYGPTAIRTEQLGFNRVYTHADASGTPRMMCSFDTRFANEVILELRSNSEFAPVPFAPSNDPSAEFGRIDRRYPILSRGPFEEEGDPELLNDTTIGGTVP